MLSEVRRDLFGACSRIGFIPQQVTLQPLRDERFGKLICIDAHLKKCQIKLIQER